MSVSLLDLLLPILLSGVAVFFASFLMWMVLPHHRKDWAALPDEDGAMAALKDVPRGQYMFPFCKGPKQMKDPEWIARREAGPTGTLVVMPRGPMKMAPMMLTSFAYNVVVSLITAYVATIALGKGAEGMDVLRLTGTVAFLGYAGALGWMVIWYFHSWASTLRSVFDALVYGLATGAIFMAFWPAA